MNSMFSMSRMQQFILIIMLQNVISHAAPVTLRTLVKYGVDESNITRGGVML